MEESERRDTKEIYAKARKGEIIGVSEYALHYPYSGISARNRRQDFRHQLSYSRFLPLLFVRSWVGRDNGAQGGVASTATLKVALVSGLLLAKMVHEKHMSISLKDAAQLKRVPPNPVPGYTCLRHPREAFSRRLSARESTRIRRGNVARQRSVQGAPVRDRNATARHQTGPLDPTFLFSSKQQ